MSTVQDEKPLLVNGDHSDRFGQFWQGGARAWEYAGQGTETRLDSATLSQQDPAMEEFDQVPGGRCSDSQNSKKKEHKTKLNQFQATSIAGNDITSSCLYVSGIAASMGEKWAPVSLMLVALVLFFFRSVYAEVGTALPLNGNKDLSSGGSYNVLLNSTTKWFASLAACLTLVSYTATAVVSATSAIAYGGYM